MKSRGTRCSSYCLPFLNRFHLIRLDWQCLQSDRVYFLPLPYEVQDRIEHQQTYTDLNDNTCAVLALHVDCVKELCVSNLIQEIRCHPALEYIPGIEQLHPSQMVRSYAGLLAAQVPQDAFVLMMIEPKALQGQNIQRYPHASLTFVGGKMENKTDQHNFFHTVSREFHEETSLTLQGKIVSENVLLKTHAQQDEIYEVSVKHPENTNRCLHFTPQIHVNKYRVMIVLYVVGVFE